MILFVENNALSTEDITPDGFSVTYEKAKIKYSLVGNSQTVITSDGKILSAQTLSGNSQTIVTGNGKLISVLEDAFQGSLNLSQEKLYTIGTKVKKLNEIELSHKKLFSIEMRSEKLDTIDINGEKPYKITLKTLG